MDVVESLSLPSGEAYPFHSVEVWALKKIRVTRRLLNAE